MLIWDMLEGGAIPAVVLNHSPYGDAQKPEIGEGIDANCPSIPFIHSLSSHPSKNDLLTAGGDFVWLWSSPEDELNEEC